MSVDHIDAVVITAMEHLPDKLMASELYALGYEPHHHTFRRRCGDTKYWICYRESPGNSHFEPAAIMIYDDHAKG